MATLRNIAISLPHLAGIIEITRTLQRVTRDQTRALLFLAPVQRNSQMTLPTPRR
jgi:hypothetical protein